MSAGVCDDHIRSNQGYDVCVRVCMCALKI